eukprot:UC1_evm4s229
MGGDSNINVSNSRCIYATLLVVVPQAILALLLLLLQLPVGSFGGDGGAIFDPSRVRFIDAVPSVVAGVNGLGNGDGDGNATGMLSYLFRGNLPLTNTSEYAWPELNATLRARAAAAGYTLPTQIYLTDLSLLQPLEHHDESSIERFFAGNPNLGRVMNWVTVGDLLHPDAVPEKQKSSLAARLPQWQVDRLPQRMTSLRDMLQNSSGRHNNNTITLSVGTATAAATATHVFYLHCEAGMDRTGEMSGSYYMRYLNWTFTKALSYDDSVETRNITVESRNSLQWYCLYLKAVSDPWRDCSLPA